MNNEYETPFGFVTDFICTYKMINNYDDSFLLYNLQLLQAFGIPDFDDEIVNKITEELYEKYKENEIIINIINNTKTKIQVQYEDLDIFRMSFRYDTFYLFHSILCSLINNKEINKEYYSQILDTST